MQLKDIQLLFCIFYSLELWCHYNKNKNSQTEIISKSVLLVIISARFLCAPPPPSLPSPPPSSGKGGLLGGAADRLQISTIQTDYKIFGRWMWPTIQIAYKNSTIHIAYTSPLYRSTTVPHGQWVECNQTEYAPYFKKYSEHSFPNKEYFFALKSTHIFFSLIMFSFLFLHLVRKQCRSASFFLGERDNAPILHQCCLKTPTIKFYAPMHEVEFYPPTWILSSSTCGYRTLHSAGLRVEHPQSPTATVVLPLMLSSW